MTPIQILALFGIVAIVIGALLWAHHVLTPLLSRIGKMFLFLSRFPRTIALSGLGLLAVRLGIITPGDNSLWNIIAFGISAAAILVALIMDYKNTNYRATVPART